MFGCGFKYRENKPYPIYRVNDRMVAVIVSVLVPLLLYVLNKASKQNIAASGEGHYKLRMNKM